MSIAFFWFFVMLLALGTPVVFALLIGPGLSLALDDQRQYFPALLSRFYNGVNSFPLLAVPFYILAGELMNAGGITRAIVNFSLSLVGHVRGGLAQVNILSSMLFAGISVPPSPMPPPSARYWSPRWSRTGDYISGAAVKKYMLAEITDHVDPITGEVNSTTLAENACSHFDGYDGDDIPEKFFELATLIAERHEIKTGIRTGSPSWNLAGLINALESDWF